MANAESKRRHTDTGEHARKNTTERAHVAGEGLWMSKYESTRKE